MEDKKFVALPVILDDCQRTTATHKKSCLTLLRLYAHDPDKFKEQLLAHIDRLLLVFKREPAVERVCKFIVHFVTSPELRKLQTGDAELGLDIIRYLLEVTDVKDKAVRFRSCQFIAGIMNSLGEDAEIDEELWQRLLDKLVVRLQDKIPIVRAAAISALCRLQSPEDEDDLVVKHYIELLNSDNNKDVRRCVLSNIGLSPLTVPHVLKRARDIKDEVRKHTFYIVQSKLTMQMLSIEQRISLLRHGLGDRDEEVQKACKELIKSWFESCVEESEGEAVVQFLQALDPANDGEAVEAVFKAALTGGLEKEILASAQALSEAGAEPEQPITQASTPWHALEKLRSDLTSERALGWRICCEHLYQQKLEGLLPDLSQLCRLLHANCEREFVVKQILKVGLVYDFSDEAGRRALSCLLRMQENVRAMLSSPLGEMLVASATAESVIEDMLILLRRTQFNEDEYTRLVIEVLSDVRDPLDELQSAEVQLAREESEKRFESLVDQIEALEARLPRSKKSERESIKKEISAYEAEAQQLQNEQAKLEELEDSVYKRGLAITAGLLQHTPKNLSDAQIAGLLSTVILPSIQQASPDVRRGAVKCFGLYCLMDNALAKSYLVLFTQVLENDEPEVKEIALQVLFDFFLYHRWRVEDFANTNNVPSQEECNTAEKDPSLANLENKFCQQPSAMMFHNLIATLCGCLNHEIDALKTTAVEGFAKLLLNGVFYDRNVLTQLVALAFSPDTEENTRARQCLSVFFSTYASTSNGCTKLEEIFLPTLRHVLDVANNAKLRVADIAAVGQFLLHLTRLTQRPSGIRIPVSSSRSNQSIDPGNEAATSDTTSPHVRLAILLAREILSNPKGDEGRYLPKLLNFIELQEASSTPDVLKELNLLGEWMAERVADRTALRSIEKFRKAVASFLQDDEKDCGEEEQVRENLEQHQRAKHNGDAQEEHAQHKDKPSKALVKQTSSNRAKTKSAKLESRAQPQTSSDKEADYDALDIETSKQTRTKEATERRNPTRRCRDNTRSQCNVTESSDSESEQTESEEEVAEPTKRTATNNKSKDDNVRTTVGRRSDGDIQESKPKLNTLVQMEETHKGHSLVQPPKENLLVPAQVRTAQPSSKKGDAHSQVSPSARKAPLKSPKAEDRNPSTARRNTSPPAQVRPSSKVQETTASTSNVRRPKSPSPDNSKTGSSLTNKAEGVARRKEELARLREAKRAELERLREEKLRRQATASATSRAKPGRNGKEAQIARVNEEIDQLLAEDVAQKPAKQVPSGARASAPTSKASGKGKSEAAGSKNIKAEKTEERQLASKATGSGVENAQVGSSSAVGGGKAPTAKPRVAEPQKKGRIEAALREIDNLLAE